MISGGKDIFPYGRNRTYIDVYTVQLYDMLKVKNALVKTVYYVTEYTIFSLVLLLDTILSQFNSVHRLLS